MTLPVLLAAALVLSACGDDREGDDRAGRSAAPLMPEHATHGVIPEGYAEVSIPTDRRQLIGLKTIPARRGTAGGTIRATGVVTTDETREAHVHSRVEGWVQKLYVNAVGQRVEKGAPLYAVYSPEVWAASQEYARAKRISPELAAAARARLAQWDIPADEIRRIAAEGPTKAVIIRSPIRGTVVELAVRQGHYLQRDTMLYRIADLSRVWILAQVYEDEAPRIDRAGEATIRVQGLVDAIRARIDYVYPTVDPTSRTVEVRLVVPNPDGALRPGAFATVELPVVASPGIWVPAEAVIETGTRSVVYLALGHGRFRPVEVHAGARAGGEVQILHGVDAGDEVVVGGQFLVDSESRLRGAAGSAAGHPGGH